MLHPNEGEAGWDERSPPRFADAVTRSGREICVQYRREQRCSHLNRYGDCRYLYIDPHGMVIHDDPEKAEDLQQYKSGTRGAMKQGRDENHNVEGIKHSKN